jgi:hypothetical protein
MHESECKGESMYATYLAQMIECVAFKKGFKNKGIDQSAKDTLIKPHGSWRSLGDGFHVSTGVALWWTNSKDYLLLAIIGPLFESMKCAMQGC